MTGIACRLQGMKNDAEITIRLPREQIDGLKKIAKLSTVSTEIRFAIAEYLERKMNVPTGFDTSTAKYAIKTRSIARRGK